MQVFYDLCIHPGNNALRGGPGQIGILDRAAGGGSGYDLGKGETGNGKPAGLDRGTGRRTAWRAPVPGLP